jgi:hypothetical protein
MTEGRLLLSLTFQPAVVMEVPGLSAPVVLSPTSKSRPQSAAKAQANEKADNAVVSSSPLVTVPGRTPPTSPPEKAKEDSSGRTEKPLAAAASPATSSDATRRHSGRSSRPASFTETRAESQAAVVAPDEARRSRTLSTSSRHSDAPSVAESAASGGGGASGREVTATAADPAPTADFYQTIAEFTERTTNSIGMPPPCIRPCLLDRMSQAHFLESVF